ncbi:MAG: fibronectin type III domain-containing protein, partial [Chitinophagales bacterium]
MKFYHYTLSILLLLCCFLSSGLYAQSISQVSAIGPSSATVTWQGCNDNNEAIRYRLDGTSDWITVSTGTISTFKIPNLRPKTHYEFEVKTGSINGVVTWSDDEKILTIGRPNLLVIMADDGRYDNYTVNGGPDFFPSPNINSIA